MKFANKMIIFPVLAACLVVSTIATNLRGNHELRANRNLEEHNPLDGDVQKKVEGSIKLSSTWSEHAMGWQSILHNYSFEKDACEFVNQHDGKWDANMMHCDTNESKDSVKYWCMKWGGQCAITDIDIPEGIQVKTYTASGGWGEKFNEETSSWRFKDEYHGPLRKHLGKTKKGILYPDSVTFGPECGFEFSLMDGYYCPSE